MVEQGLLLLALVAAVLSVPFSLLCATFLAGADDTANNNLASLVGVLVVPASILSVMAVLALLRGDPWAHTEVVLVAPAALATIAGPFAGPRSMHRSEPPKWDIVTSQGYFRADDPDHPQRATPSRRRLLTEVAQMVGLFLVVPALVVVAGIVG